MRRKGSREDIITKKSIFQAMLDYHSGLLTRPKFLFKIAAKYQSSLPKENFELDEDDSLTPSIL